MFVELQSCERDLVTRLVEARIRELPGEIRRTDNQELHEQLKEELSMLEGLLHRLHESAWDVMC